jgi:multiple sugar transport system substrate-binding protein
VGEFQSQNRPLSRRRFLRLSVGLGAGTALAACSRGGGGALGGGGEGGKVTRLVVPANTSPWLAAYQATAREYEKQSGVQITLREFPYDGLRTAMVNAIRGGNFPFDLFHLDEPWTGEFYANEWATPLTEVKSDFKLDKDVSSYDALPRWDQKQRRHSKDGAVMGLPINGNVNVFVYRKDLYDELGLSVPKTFEEAFQNGSRAQQSGKARFGYVARAQATQGGQSISYDFMPLLRTYGGDWYTADYQPAINNAGAVAAMEMFKRLLSLGPRQPQTVGQAEVIATMQGGQSIQCHTVAAAAAQLEDPSKSRVAGKLGYAEIPAGSTGKPTPTSGVWSLAIPRGLPAERAKASLDFISWFLTEEAQLVFTRAGGIPTRTETYDSGEVPAQAQKYLPAIKQSLDDIRGSVRFPFSAELLPVAEQSLTAIAAGGTPVKEGLDDLANRLAEIARKAGFGG